MCAGNFRSMLQPLQGGRIEGNGLLAKDGGVSKVVCLQMLLYRNSNHFNWLKSPSSSLIMSSFDAKCVFIFQIYRYIAAYMYIVSGRVGICTAQSMNRSVKRINSTSKVWVLLPEINLATALISYEFLCISYQEFDFQVSGISRSVRIIYREVVSRKCVL